MTVQRLDNVGIVFEDLEGAITFFTELGLELEGRATIDGEWASRAIGVPGSRCEIAMLRTPDGHGRLELARYLTPTAHPATPAAPPPNTIGFHRVMFAVTDIDDTVARLQALGGELLDEISQYEDSYRLTYLRGPEGVVIGLAQQLD